MRSLPSTSVSPSSTRRSANGARAVAVHDDRRAEPLARARRAEKWSACVCVSIDVAQAQAVARQRPR